MDKKELQVIAKFKHDMELDIKRLNTEAAEKEREAGILRWQADGIQKALNKLKNLEIHGG